MFLRAHRRAKDGKGHSYWSLVETVRTPDGPRQKTLCYLGELNSSAQARWLGLELWKRLELDRFFEQAVDEHEADVPWSRVAAVLAINRLCAPGSELAIEERWYPSAAL